MHATIHRMSVPLLLSLLLVVMSLVFVLPRVSFADDGTMSKVPTDDTARGEEEAVFLHEALPLDAVLTYAQGHNATIRATRARLRAAQERPAQASALDDPMFTYEGFSMPENLDVSRTDSNILKFSQKLPFPGKRRLRGEIATHEAAIAREDMRKAEVLTRAEVTKAYYDLWQVHQNLLVYSHEKELAAQFATIAEKKYAVGQVSQPDVLRAQVELTRLINRVTTQTLKLGEVRAMLNGILSRPPEAPLGVPQEAPHPVGKHTLSELTELTLNARPEITANAAALARDAATLALSRKSYFPDFEVYVERFFNGGRKDGVGVIFSATIPLAYREKYDAGVAEATARLSASKADLRAAQDIALAEVKGALVRAQTAVELVNLFAQTHIPQAEQALASSQIGYQTGKVDFLSLIDSLRIVEQVHLEHIAAATDFEKAYADLEQAVGQELPRK